MDFDDNSNDLKEFEQSIDKSLSKRTKARNENARRRVKFKKNKSPISSTQRDDIDLRIGLYLKTTDSIKKDNFENHNVISQSPNRSRDNYNSNTVSTVKQDSFSKNDDDGTRYLSHESDDFESKNDILLDDDDVVDLSIDDNIGNIGKNIRLDWNDFAKKYKLDEEKNQANLYSRGTLFLVVRDKLQIYKKPYSKSRRYTYSSSRNISDNNIAGIVDEYDIVLLDLNIRDYTSENYVKCLLPVNGWVYLKQSVINQWINDTYDYNDHNTDNKETNIESIESIGKIGKYSLDKNENVNSIEIPIFDENGNKSTLHDDYNYRIQTLETPDLSRQGTYSQQKRQSHSTIAMNTNANLYKRPRLTAQISGSSLAAPSEIELNINIQALGMTNYKSEFDIVPLLKPLPKWVFEDEDTIAKEKSKPDKQKKNSNNASTGKKKSCNDQILTFVDSLIFWFRSHPYFAGLLVVLIQAGVEISVFVDIVTDMIVAVELYNANATILFAWIVLLLLSAYMTAWFSAYQSMTHKIERKMKKLLQSQSISSTNVSQSKLRSRSNVIDDLHVAQSCRLSKDEMIVKMFGLKIVRVVTLIMPIGIILLVLNDIWHVIEYALYRPFIYIFGTGGGTACKYLCPPCYNCCCACCHETDDENMNSTSKNVDNINDYNYTSQTRNKRSRCVRLCSLRNISYQELGYWKLRRVSEVFTESLPQAITMLGILVITRYQHHIDARLTDSAERLDVDEFSVTTALCSSFFVLIFWVVILVFEAKMNGMTFVEYITIVFQGSLKFIPYLPAIERGKETGLRVNWTKFRLMNDSVSEINKALFSPKCNLKCLKISMYTIKSLNRNSCKFLGKAIAQYNYHKQNDLEVILTRNENELRQLFRIYSLTTNKVRLNFEEFTRVCLALRKQVSNNSHISLHTISKLYWELASKGKHNSDENINLDRDCVWLLDLLFKMQSAKQRIPILDYDHPLLHAIECNNVELATFLVNCNYHESSSVRGVEYTQCIIKAIKQEKYKIAMALCEHKGVPILIEIKGCNMLDTAKVSDIINSNVNSKRLKRNASTLSNIESDSDDSDFGVDNNHNISDDHIDQKLGIYNYRVLNPNVEVTVNNRISKDTPVIYGIRLDKLDKQQRLNNLQNVYNYSGSNSNTNSNSHSRSKKSIVGKSMTDLVHLTSPGTLVQGKLVKKNKSKNNISGNKSRRKQRHCEENLFEWHKGNKLLFILPFNVVDKMLNRDKYNISSTNVYSNNSSPSNTPIHNPNPFAKPIAKAIAEEITKPPNGGDDKDDDNRNHKHQSKLNFNININSNNDNTNQLQMPTTIKKQLETKPKYRIAITRTASNSNKNHNKDDRIETKLTSRSNNTLTVTRFSTMRSMKSDTEAPVPSPSLVTPDPPDSAKVTYAPNKNNYSFNNSRLMPLYMEKALIKNATQRLNKPSISIVRSLENINAKQVTIVENKDDYKHNSNNNNNNNSNNNRKYPFSPSSLFSQSSVPESFTSESESKANSSMNGSINISNFKYTWHAQVKPNLTGIKALDAMNSNISDQFGTGFTVRWRNDKKQSSRHGQSDNDDSKQAASNLWSQVYQSIAADKESMRKIQHQKEIEYLARMMTFRGKRRRNSSAYYDKNSKNRHTSSARGNIFNETNSMLANKDRGKLTLFLKLNHNFDDTFLDIHDIDDDNNSNTSIPHEREYIGAIKIKIDLSRLQNVNQENKDDDMDDSYYNKGNKRKFDLIKFREKNKMFQTLNGYCEQINYVPLKMKQYVKHDNNKKKSNINRQRFLKRQSANHKIGKHLKTGYKMVTTAEISMRSYLNMIAIYAKYGTKFCDM